MLNAYVAATPECIRTSTRSRRALLTIFQTTITERRDLEAVTEFLARRPSTPS